MVRGVPAFWLCGRESTNSNAIGQAVFTTWTMENAAEEWKRARQPLVI